MEAIPSLAENDSRGGTETTVRWCRPASAIHVTNFERIDDGSRIPTCDCDAIPSHRLLEQRVRRVRFPMESG